MKMDDKDNIVFSFFAGHQPVSKLDPGEVLVVETADSFNGQIHEEGQSLKGIDLGKVPTTGPFYIEGAEPGDALEIAILEIGVASRGILVYTPEKGMLAEGSGHIVKVYDLTAMDNCLVLAEGLAVPIRPVIGVIGVAPLSGEVGNEFPGVHGGRLWAREVCPGSTISLPVFHEGALFALGDIQLLLGEGAVCGCGIAARATVKFKVEVIKGAKLTGPQITADGGTYFLADGPSLEEATRKACLAGVDQITKVTGLVFTEACIIAGAVGQLGLCRSVGPPYLAKFFVPQLFKVLPGE